MFHAILALNIHLQVNEDVSGYTDVFIFWRYVSES